MYRLVFGYFPYYSKDRKNLINQIINSPLRMPDNIKISRKLHNLLMQLLIKDSNIRITSPQLLLHPWIKDERILLSLSCNPTVTLSNAISTPIKRNQSADLNESFSPSNHSSM